MRLTKPDVRWNWDRRTCPPIDLWSELLIGWGMMMKPSTLPETAWPCFPTIPACIIRWVWPWREKGDFLTATNQFAYALLFTPDWVEVHLNFGQALLYLGDTPNGLRHLQEAVRLAPDSPLALNELAWLLATSPDAALRNGPEAVQLAEHGCAVTSRRNPTLLDTLAAAYAEAGRFPEAINAAQEALVPGPDDGR